MGRPRKRMRASEGKRTAKRVRRNGKVYEYVEYSFVTPLWAFDKWPNVKLPARTRKTFPKGRELDGEAWLNESLRAVHAGTWIPERLRKARAEREAITFREFASDWVEHRKRADGIDLRETSKQKYRESLDLYLLPFFGDMPLADITPKDVQAWFDAFTTSRLDADRDNRRAHVYAHLKTMMRSAATDPIDNEGNTLIPASPCRIKVGKPAVKHVPIRPTREQLDALLSVLPDWVKIMVLLCDGTGLRESEALGLRRRHIDLEGLKINVSEQVQRVTGETLITPPKTDSSIRAARMTQALADRLAEWIERNGIIDPDAHLFVSARTGRVLYGQSYRNVFAKARKQIPGLETMRAHDLRKDCLSRMLEMGATQAEVMRQGGHKTMSVASKYQVTGENHMKAVMARMNDYETGTGSQPASATAPKTPKTPADVDRVGDDASDAELAALAGILAVMSVADRVAALKPLPAERRARVLERMPSDVRVPTVTELLREATA